MIRFAPSPILLIAAALLLPACSAPVAITAGDTPEESRPSRMRGEAFALDHCARCHDIRGAATGERNVPSLETIARRYDLPTLGNLFRSGVDIPQHAGLQMPPFQLTSNQADDLMAFLQGLAE